MARLQFVGSDRSKLVESKGRQRLPPYPYGFREVLALDVEHRRWLRRARAESAAAAVAAATVGSDAAAGGAAAATSEAAASAAGAAAGATEGKRTAGKGS